MTIVANMRLGTCRARFRRGLGASQACLGRILAALGPLLASFWKHLDVSWTPFARFLNTLGRIWALMGASASILEGLWCLWAGCWRAPVAIFAMVFGHAFRVSPLVLHNASIAKGNPYWHFLGLSFSPCGAVVRALYAHGIVVFAQLGRLFWTLCVSCCITFCYRSPRATSLRPAERHNPPHRSRCPGVSDQYVLNKA